MRKFTHWLATRLLPDGEDFRDPPVRLRLGQLEGWTSVVVNLVLALVKLLLGVLFQSAGLISDAVHSLGDLVSSFVVILSFRISRKPPDLEHPFGHAKMEQVGTLIIAVMLVVAGFELGKNSIEGLIAGTAGEEMLPLTWGLFGVLVGLLLAKELLARFSSVLGEIIDSPTLKADAWHHRTDALTTGIVIIGLGGRNFGLLWMDGAAGLIVALFVAGTGFQMAYGSISPLLGETAPAEEIARVKEMATRVPGVVSVHDFKVQRYGWFYFTTLHIEMSDEMNVHKMHEISVQMETRILQHFPGECVVHLDPIDYNHPLFHRVTDGLKEVVVSHPDLVEFHDLKLWSDKGGEQGDVEISVDPSTPEDSYPSIRRYVLQEIRRRFPELQFDVRLKIDFSATPLDSG